MDTPSADSLPVWRLNLLRATYLLMAAGLGLVLIPLVLPWRYLYDHYLARPAERWR